MWLSYVDLVLEDVEVGCPVREHDDAEAEREELPRGGVDPLQRLLRVAVDQGLLHGTSPRLAADPLRQSINSSAMF